MPTSLSRVIDSLLNRDDPRLNADFWRTIPAGETNHGAVVVGVVHDHPASRFRVRAVADALEPEALALELPDIAVPSFEKVADGSPTESVEGGEMSAAIAAAPEADVVGVDTVGPRFLHRLAANARAEGASTGTVRHVLGDVASIARHALACRVAGDDVLLRWTAADHDVCATDRPAVQAEDERTHVARSRALLGAVRRPHADLLLDGTREENMAGRIGRLRGEGPVLAVVGVDHLDRVATLLE